METNRRTAGWVDRQVGGWLDRQLDGQAGGRANKQAGGDSWMTHLCSDAFKDLGKAVGC